MTDELTPENVQAIEDAIARGQKLEAIKRYRDATGKGLKESKDFIDALIPQLLERDPERYANAKAGASGCGSAAALLIAFVIAVIGAVSALRGEETAPAQRPAASEGEMNIPGGYSAITHDGWRWIVRSELTESQPELWAQVRSELEHQLYEIERRVPPTVVDRMKQVPIWIELDHPRHPALAYHPSQQWLTSNNMLPQKARCVEISNAKNFVNWSLQQPFCVLHEMAHAWHHQVLPEGFGNRDVLVCFERAKSTGLYDTVLRSNGRIEKAYASNNQQEYFAEASEAFFGVNDFYPFLNAELKQHDPEMHTLLQQLWTLPAAGKVEEVAPAVKKPTGAELPVGSSQ